MATSASSLLASATASSIPSSSVPTTFATSIISATNTRTLPSATNTRAPTRSPTSWSPANFLATYVPSSYITPVSSTSDDNSNDGNYHKLNSWVAALVGMAGVAVLAIIFVSFIHYLKNRAMKRAYAEALETEPSLEWSVFKTRYAERVRRNVQLAEEEEERELVEGREALRARREERRNLKMQKKYNKKIAKAQAHGDSSVLLEQRDPPPYSSVLDPESEVGMKPW